MTARRPAAKRRSKRRATPPHPRRDVILRHLDEEIGSRQHDLDAIFQSINERIGAIDSDPAQGAAAARQLLVNLGLDVGSRLMLATMDGSEADVIRMRMEKLKSPPPPTVLNARHDGENWAASVETPFGTVTTKKPFERAPSLEAAEDPWKHRSQRMRCTTCMWFVEKVSENAGTTFGRCRRHAPRPEGGGWPAVFGTDWCGDHKLDERKA